jgi:hypothetical protein
MAATTSSSTFAVVVVRRTVVVVLGIEDVVDEVMVVLAPVVVVWGLDGHPNAGSQRQNQKEAELPHINGYRSA